MMNNIEISRNLSLFGLNNKEVQTYSILLGKGPQTPLELSRATNINRTTTYRVLEKLKELGLVEEVLGQKSTSFQARGPERLKMIIAQKEAEISKLNEGLPDLITQLSAVQIKRFASTKAIYFRGQRGLQQLLWNTLKSPKKSTVVGYGCLDWNTYLGEKFAEKLRQKYVEKQIYSKEISNRAYKDFTENKNYLEKIYQNRTLLKSKLEINHNTYIYNDVFCFYGKYGEEFYGIEIQNSEIAKTQRQIFYLLWRRAKKV